MKINLRFLFSFALIILISEIVIAEPKQLICISDETALDEAARLRANDRNDLAKKCENSNFPSASKTIFFFDSDGLKSQIVSDIRVTSAYCHGMIDDMLGKMTHTPSFITFQYTKYWDWGYVSNLSINVDRKTLRAGNGETKDLSCRLEDIDTSENIL